MRSNDGCCNNVPIRFASAKEMFEYLQDVGDLYSPDERIYVFNYSESGALAVYRIYFRGVRHILFSCDCKKVAKVLYLHRILLSQ